MQTRNSHQKVEYIKPGAHGVNACNGIVHRQSARIIAAIAVAVAVAVAVTVSVVDFSVCICVADIATRTQTDEERREHNDAH
jgi:hypothetical protein